MRLLLAGLFIFFGMMGVVAGLFELGPKDPPSWLIVPVAVVSFFVLLGGAFVLFNVAGSRAPRSPRGDSIEQMEAKGLLVSTDFQARRAFQIEEFEDEGAHYVIELQDGSTLYLNGQYLYDYEPITDDPELNRPRLFPCTDFTVRRHKASGEGIDILCRGDLIEPEFVAPSFDEMDFKRGLVPEDGQLITDKSYEELKRERLKGKTVKQK